MLKSTKRAVLALIVSLLGMISTPTYAQPSPDFPEHRTTQIDGVRYEAFDLGGFRSLLVLDFDLVATRALVANLERSLELSERARGLLSQAYDSSLADIDILQSERNRLEAQWVEENRLRLEAENKPEISKWLGWGLASALAVAIVSIVVTISVTGD